MSRSTPSPSKLFTNKPTSSSSSDFLCATNTTVINVTDSYTKDHHQHHQGMTYYTEEIAQQRYLCNEIIQTIRRLNIKLIAFDFDQTIVSVHTGGIWSDAVEKLAEFVRPCFRYLIPELLKCEDLHIAIVTFSPQKDLIKSVLRLSMPIDNYLHRIVIRGNTKDMFDKYGVETCFSFGKELHLNECRDYLEMTVKSLKILNKHILLIDDDYENINYAHKEGHFAYHVSKTVGLDELLQFLNRNLINSN